MADSPQAIRDFVDRHYRHFNARTLRDAARAWRDQLEQGHRMLLTLAGAMSTAELGISLAELIRQEKIHALCCTGANLEEDLFNLVAHDAYEHIPDWRALTAEQEMALAERGLNRVTDTCIPEDAAMRKIEAKVLARWRAADEAGESHPPHRFLYELLLSGELDGEFQIDPTHSWLMAAAERDLPLFVPGWEDSTLGNMLVAAAIRGDISSVDVVESGLHAMRRLADWYTETTGATATESTPSGPESDAAEVGFFQIGGGIAGDFPICVVPMLNQDLGLDVPLWSYFCQISDSTTSYGSYSGAVPNEKITWGKLDPSSPKFLIESDATIVAPLVFAYVLAP